MQTERPYWLNESYASAITSLDVGLVNRNIQYSGIIEEVIYKNFDTKARFLDFAGGYGVFTRIMRDKGFDFYHEDKYCENIFSKNFDINDLKEKDRKFELVTAFELIEHSEDPYKELDYILSMSSNFLFSTELVPEENLENWWYLGEEHGQHISFFTKKSIEKIAKKYGKKYYSNGYMHLLSNKDDLHVFEKKIKLSKIIDFIKGKINPSVKLPSRTQTDFEYVRSLIKNEIKQ